jgi:hypothetical protein
MLQIVTIVTDWIVVLFDWSMLVSTSTHHSIISADNVVHSGAIRDAADQRGLSGGSCACKGRSKIVARGGAKT